MQQFDFDEFRVNYKTKISKFFLYYLKNLKDINNFISIAFIKNYGLNTELLQYKLDAYSNRPLYEFSNLINSVFYKNKYMYIRNLNICGSLFSLTKYFFDQIKINNKGYINPYEGRMDLNYDIFNISAINRVITISNHNKKSGQNKILRNYLFLSRDIYEYSSS